MAAIHGQTFHLWGALDPPDSLDSLETRVLPELQLTLEQRGPRVTLDLPARLGITEPMDLPARPGITEPRELPDRPVLLARSPDRPGITEPRELPDRPVLLARSPDRLGGLGGQDRRVHNLQ